MRNTLYDDTAVRTSILPQVVTTGTIEGARADMAGTHNNFRVALVIVHAGTLADGTHTPSLEESANGADFTAVDAADLQGAFTAFTAALDERLQRVAYTGSKQFLRVKLVSAAAAVGGPMSAVILMGQGSGRPVT